MNLAAKVQKSRVVYSSLLRYKATRHGNGIGTQSAAAAAAGEEIREMKMTNASHSSPAARPPPRTACGCACATRTDGGVDLSCDDLHPFYERVQFTERKEV